MDSLTHIVVGAVAGEALAKKSLGKHALWLGAAAQSLPDIDIIASAWTTPAEDLLAHRGFTHSLLFLVLAALALSYAASKIFRTAGMSWKNWLLFFGVELFLHLFFDVMNAYGTGLFEPFSHMRVSFNVLFVADPLFTLWPAAAAVALMMLRIDSTKRNRWIKFGLSVSATYLCLAILVKLYITNKADSQFTAEHISLKRSFTSPTAFNILLWSVVGEDDDGFQVGYRSVFDTKNSPLHHIPRNEALASEVKDKYELALVKRFSQGYYSFSKKEDNLILTDLRFGQIFGWINPDAPFVFQYYLDQPEENLLLIQRGRFTNWNDANIEGTLKRMIGN